MVHVKVLRHSERLDYANILYWLLHLGSYRADAPLSNRGHDMARTAGAIMRETNVTFNPKIIYTSPYNRTISTATELNVAFPQSKIVIEPLLAEHQPRYAHTISLYPYGIPTSYEGIETGFIYPETSYAQFEKRINFILDKLVSNSESDLMIVTHGEVIRAIARYIQIIYPDTVLDIGTVPYLTSISFEYIDGEIVEDSIKVDFLGGNGGWLTLLSHWQ